MVGTLNKKNINQPQKIPSLNGCNPKNAEKSENFWQNKTQKKRICWVLQLRHALMRLINMVACIISASCVFFSSSLNIHNKNESAKICNIHHGQITRILYSFHLSKKATTLRRRARTNKEKKKKQNNNRHALCVDNQRSGWVTTAAKCDTMRLCE